MSIGFERIPCEAVGLNCISDHDDDDDDDDDNDDDGDGADDAEDNEHGDNDHDILFFFDQAMTVPIARPQP